jgi:2-amino-4-hydroxy-6-hydroxymethyldihydropteridine diphosphokinase
MIPKTVPALISLGSNLNPEKNIQTAARLLAKKVGHMVTSSVWESPAVGSSGPNYLNCAALFQTNLPLKGIKTNVIAPIEEQLGRIRGSDKYMDRTIDLDVLIYANQTIDPELWTQAHLAIPASELMPGFMNNDTGETLLDTAKRLSKLVGIFQHLDLN